MGIKCSNTAEVYFEDVKIPAENLLGGEFWHRYVWDKNTGWFKITQHSIHDNIPVFMNFYSHASLQ